MLGVVTPGEWSCCTRVTTAFAAGSATPATSRAEGSTFAVRPPLHRQLQLPHRREGQPARRRRGHRRRHPAPLRCPESRRGRCLRLGRRRYRILRRRRYQGLRRALPRSLRSQTRRPAHREHRHRPGYEHRCWSPTPPMTATARLPRCKPCSAEPDPASSYSPDYPRRRPRLGHRQRPQRPSSPLSVLRPPHHLPRPPPEISSGHHQTSQRRNGQPGSAWRLLRNVLTSLAISSGYSPLMAWEASG